MKTHLSILLCVLLAACTRDPISLTIIHTNDTHSQVEPTHANEGGYARRMGLIEQQRAIDPELLLLDAGDYWQGTPYFNIFHGRVEIAAMNQMGYDAATLGNHEFDYGLDSLAARLKEANFPIVCANYGVEGTVLEGIIQPYCIVHRKGLKIGIFGLGVSPDGLIADRNFGDIRFLDPYEQARLAVQELQDQGCDLIICLSHLGTYRLDDPKAPSDAGLVENVSGIDIVLGGHTHKVYDIKLPNAEGREIPVRQMGKSGRFVGKIILNLQEIE